MSTIYTNRQTEKKSGGHNVQTIWVKYQDQPSFEVTGIIPFCEQQNINMASVYLALNGKIGSVNGVRFSRSDDFADIESIIVDKQFIYDNCLTVKGSLNNRVNIESWWANRNFQSALDYIRVVTGWAGDISITEQLYLICNEVTKFPLCLVCGLNKTAFDNFKDGYKKHCSIQCSTHSVERNNKIRENTDYVALHELAKARNIERYGVEYYFQTDKFQAKAKATKLERYGDENYNNIDLSRVNNLQKYGVDTPLKIPAQQEKMRKAKFEKHGTTVPPNAKKSIAELDIKAYMLSIGFKLYTNRKILGNRELDGYSFDKNIAFEYCGLYWHSEYKKPNDTKYHHDKYSRCKELGVRLITIFEDEWMHRQSQVKQFLRSTFGSFDRRLYARQCIVKEIPNQDSYKFFESYHIQGRPHAAVKAYGLFNNDELVGCVSYGRHHRNSSQLVLNRLAFKDGVQIVGGASKLIKNTIDNFKCDVITWADNRWSTGNIYEQCGFIFDSELAPDYSYVKLNNGIRVSKQSMKKSETGCPAHITEKDFCESMGYYRIYDCGKRRYVYKYNGEE